MLAVLVSRNHARVETAAELSGRGELEITDVNNFYIAEKTLTYEILDGWWTDAGTFESLQRANSLVAESGANKISFAATAAPITGKVVAP